MGAAAARRLLDDDAVGGTQRGNLLQQIAIGQSSGGRAAPRAAECAGGCATCASVADCASSAATPSFRLVTMEVPTGHQAAAAGIVGQLHQLRARPVCAALAFDVVGEHRCAEHQDQIAAVAAAATIRGPIGRQEAGE